MAKKIDITLKFYVKLRLLELYAYFSSLFFPTPKNQLKVVIFGQGRTGSTLLESLIESTGYFKKNGELLTSKYIEVLWPLKFILGKAKIAGKESFIFHLKIYHLTADRKTPVDPSEFINYLYKAGWKVIYLNRKNKVRHVLSNLVADQRGGYHKHDGKTEKFKLNIDLDQFDMMINNRFMYTKQEREILSNIDYHEIVYEEDLQKQEKHKDTIEGIAKFLSLDHDSIKVNTSHKKVNTQSLSDLIVNHEEFIAHLKSNGWYHFINEESDS